MDLVKQRGYNISGRVSSNVELAKITTLVNDEATYKGLCIFGCFTVK